MGPAGRLVGRTVPQMHQRDIGEPLDGRTVPQAHQWDIGEPPAEAPAYANEIPGF